MHGFLGCIGWKVLKYSLKVATGKAFYEPFATWKWWLLKTPILFIGIPLYVLKKRHIGNPMATLSFFLIVPAALFYIFIAALQIDMQSMRDQGWLYQEIEPMPFMTSGCS